jgi:hypothetical protein
MKRLSICALLLTAIYSFPALAEPYLAVRSGQKCSSCHVNPTGGGKRSDAGTIYGLQVLPGQAMDNGWSGRVNQYLAAGADFRASLQYLDRENSDNESAFETERTSLYLEFTPIPDRLTLYIDQLLSPSASNREAYVLAWNEQREMYLKVGKMFLPYGLRLEDDNAFIRRVSGINFSNADNGIEGGYESADWSIQTALSNGTNGGSENNTDKQISLRIENIQPSWRSGISINRNEGLDSNERNMWNIFGGLNWLGVNWLFEYDSITDENGSNEIESSAALLEANYLISKGHNLKLTFEAYDPDNDVSEDQQTRNSVVWEYTPVSLLQLRVGLRLAEGIPQAVDDQNDDILFVQLHNWF